MNDVLKIYNKLNEAVKVEIKMGYKNAAVFGGFNAFALSTLDKLPIASLIKAEQQLAVGMIRRGLENYASISVRDRAKVIKELHVMLDALSPKLKQPISNNKPKKLSPKASIVKTASAKATVDNPANLKVKDLQYIKNVGPKRLRLLNRIGINSIEDLLYHFPRRYEDRSTIKKFHQLIDGDTDTVMGTVLSHQDIKPRKGMTITKAAIHDGMSIGYAVWFNQPYVKKQIPQGNKIIFTGKVDRKYGSVHVTVMDFETVDNDDILHSGRIVPVYPTTEGLQPRVLRTIIKSALDDFGQDFDEFLPPSIMVKYNFLDLFTSLNQIHFPDKLENIAKARKRLVFEEFFLLQLGVGLMKADEIKEDGVRHKKDGPLLANFNKSLPFPLTNAQRRVIKEIFADMESDTPMNRLVQGDVGSGKTIVAASALVKCVESGFQGAMMAPTEILAGQHYEGLSELLVPLGIKVALLSGGLSKGERGKVIQDIKEGRVDIVVGTHAIIQEEIEFFRLGLAITDEQHRFGVKQRAKLKEKGSSPDLLVMTATPIPRTLALTVYGDLDVSVIDELPPGRQEIKTFWINSRMKDRVYKFIRDQVSAGRQVYYVCPLVEESEKIDITAAVELAEFLQTRVFPDLKVGLMHGRLKQDVKDLVMREFKNGNIDILVATTVVEVGVNVPNSTLIVIDNADRFGLAQLHQLRGRVGRGAFQSYCILIADPSTEEGKARMNIMQKTTDGFLIAEEDLKIRGPGEFFGTKQSGMPDLKIADIIKDVKILQVARDEALKLINSDPGLNKPEHSKLKTKVIEKFRSTDNYFKIS